MKTMRNNIRDFLQVKNNTFYCIVTILVSIIMCVTIYWKFIFGNAYLIGSTDVMYQNYSYMFFLTQNLEQGKIPTWTFLIGIGDVFPLRYLGNILDVWICFWGTKTLPYLFVYNQILKIVLSSFFFYKFLNRIKISNLGATFGAISYSFSSIMIIRGLWYAYATEVLLFAFLLWAFEIYFQEEKRSALLIALVLLFTYKGMYYVVLYCLICLIYATARYYICEGKILSINFFKYLLKGFINILLAGGISCVINIPIFLQTLNSARIDTAGAANEIPMFADQTRIGAAFLKCFSPILFSGYGGDLYNSNGLDGPHFYFGIIVPIIIPLFIYLENNRIKVLTVVLSAFLLIYVLFPQVTYICNLGISYEYFKLSTLWICTAFLIIAVFIVDQVIIKNTYKYIFFLTCVLLLESAIYYLGFKNELYINKIAPKYIIAVMVYILLYFIVLSSYKKLKSKQILIIAIILLCVELGYSARVTMDTVYTTIQYAGYTKGNDMKTNSALVDVEELTDGYQRVRWKDGYPSRALLYGVPGVGYYDDIDGNYVNYLNNIYGIGNAHFCKVNEYGQQWLGDILLGVKYNVVSSKKKILPELNYIIKEYNEYSLIGNKLCMPLGVMYEDYINYEQMQDLSYEQRQYNLLNAIVSDQSNSQTLIYPKEEVNIKTIYSNDHSITFEEKDDTYVLDILEKNATICFELDNVQNNNLEISFKLDSQNYDYNICNILVYDGYAWKQIDSLNDKEMYECFSDDSKNQYLNIYDTNVCVFALQFVNGLDRVKIKDVKVSQYDRNIVINDVKALIDERIQQGYFNINEFSDTKISGEVDCKRQGTLLLSIPYNKGWKAYTDGIEVSISKVDYGLMSIPMEEGKHDLVLRYELPGLKLGIGITIISICITIMLELQRKYQKRKTKE